MARFGFVGPTYQSQSVNSDVQRAVNWYVEANESQQGKSAMVLYPSPGLKVFGTLPVGAVPEVRGLFVFNGRCFAVSDTTFCELLADGTTANPFTVTSDGNPVSMAANGANQILLASAGILYVFNLNTNVLTAVAGAPANISLVGYIDGFFAALTKNSNTFQLSNLLDGTTWSGLNVAKTSVFPENIVSFIVDHRELAIIGQKQSVVYYDSGNTFPLDVIPGGFVEQGGAAVYGSVRADNSVFWLGADERGNGVFWRNNGYTPTRVSNHAVEYAWSRYPRIDDAIVYSFVDQGHTFVHVYFPSGFVDTALGAGASWRYDCATGMWHEALFWDAVNNRYTAHRSQCHVFAFGKHLVGDWQTGNVYQMDTGIFDDFGNSIRRMRRAPHISTEQEWLFHHQMQLDVETGVGKNPPLTGPDLSAPKYPNSIILQDANGVLWHLGITDGGNFSIFPVASGTPQTIILKDSGMFPSSAWQLGITIAGNLTTTPITVSGSGYGSSYGADLYGSSAAAAALNYPQIYNLMSIPGNHPGGILVTVNGNLQVNVPDLSRDPQICLRWSDDGGHTWSAEHWVGVGKVGQYRTRAIWRRLGRSRDRVYEVSATDPVAWRIIDAYLDASPGFVPTERLTHQLRKGA